MGKRSYVGTDGHGNSCRDLLAEILNFQFQHFMFSRGLSRRGRVAGEVVKNREGRHCEDLLLAHQPHGLVAELVRMIDGYHASPRRECSSRLSRRMHGDMLR